MKCWLVSVSGYALFKFLDEQKRAVYDRYGEEGLNGGGGAGGGMGMNAEDLFSSLFGGGGGGMFGGGGGGRQQQRRGKDVGHELRVTLEDLYKGKTSRLALSKTILCTACKGKGGREGVEPKPCQGCRGTGVKTTLRQMGPMIQQMQAPCNECSGEGEKIASADRCPQCNGKKVQSEKKVLEVNVEKGMKDEQHITFSGEGDQQPGIVPGDVIIVLREQKHARFERRNADLVYKAEIELITALTGGQFLIEHLDGRKLLVEILAGEIIKPGDIKVIRDEGMPVFKRSHENGDLYIEFTVKFPDAKDLAGKNLKALSEILPAAKPLPSFKHDEVDEYVLSDVHPGQGAGQKSAANNNGSQMDEDDEPGQGPQVQCAQQ